METISKDALLQLQLDRVLVFSDLSIEFPVKTGETSENETKQTSNATEQRTDNDTNNAERDY